MITHVSCTKSTMAIMKIDKDLLPLMIKHAENMFDHWAEQMYKDPDNKYAYTMMCEWDDELLRLEKQQDERI